MDVELAVVASAIGKPLSLDLATKLRWRFSYARICVEMNVDNTMPADITVNLRGEEFTINVTYKWKPRKCNLCHSFGHSSSTCPKSVGKEASINEDVRKVDPVKEVVLVKVVVLAKEYGDVVLESFNSWKKERSTILN